VNLASIIDEHPADAVALISQGRSTTYGPHLGIERPDIADGVRAWPVGRYLILYRDLGGGVEIVRYIHGARRLRDLL
jgi:toxin ParE1/3/4